MQNRINLLSPSTGVKKPSKEGPSKVMVYGGVSLVFLSILIYGVLFVLDYKADTQLKETSKEIQRLSEVSSMAGEYNRLKQEKSGLAAAIKQISNSKPVFSKSMDEIAKQMPVSVKLKSLDVQLAPPNIKIIGTAPSHAEVAQFQGNLLNSTYLKNCYIKGSIKDEKSQLTNFSIIITPMEGGLK